MVEGLQGVSAPDVLAAALALVEEAVLVIEWASGRIGAANLAATVMFGFAEERLVGAHWRSALHAGWEALPEQGVGLEALGRRPDGRTFPVLCAVKRVGARAVCVVRDLGERRALERRVLEARVQVRREIGRDLHDGLGQLLTGTAFLAKGLEAQVASGYRAQAQRVVELLNLAIAQVRGTARGLSNMYIDIQSLEHALRDIVAESTMLLGVDCRLEAAGGGDDVPPAAISQVYLIVREAITNAVRHGVASVIVVRLERWDGKHVLTVEDNGSGIDELRIVREGIGLRSMRERAASLGGQLEVTRAVGGAGTVVRVWW